MYFKVKLEKLNKFLVSISSITLEIYVVQYVIIDLFEKIIFPINFILITSLIILVAYAVKYANIFITKTFLSFNYLLIGRKD